MLSMDNLMLSLWYRDRAAHLFHGMGETIEGMHLDMAGLDDHAVGGNETVGAHQALVEYLQE